MVRMALRSIAFRNDPRLQQCAVSHPAHVTPGSRGPHVRLIQAALEELDGATIALSEIETAFYGPSTASAVLTYKTDRKIINSSYQRTADNIVGLMTVKAMDDELLANEDNPTRFPSNR